MGKNNSFKWDGKFIRFIELLFDATIMVVSILFVYSLRIFVDNRNIYSVFEFFSNFQNYFLIPKIIISNSIYIFVTLFVFVLYRATVIANTYFQALVSTYFSLIFSFLALVILDYFFAIEEVGMFTLFAVFASEIILFGALKYPMYRFISKRCKKSIILIGNEYDMKNYLSKFLYSLPNGRIIKYIYIKEENQKTEDIASYIDECDMVYLMPNVEVKIKNQIMKYCFSKRGIDVCIVPQTYEVAINNAKLETVDDALVYKVERLELSLTYRFFKRLFDLFFSIIAIIILLPFMLIIALLIKIFDKGPVLYTQERITINNSKYKLLKFRTMTVDAEKQTGAIWAVKDDPRITKVGYYLRKFRLDELPQLFNVLKGEMSFVGPRPERQIFIEAFAKDNPDFILRENVKAGITGMAQIYGRYNTKPDDKLRFDLYYIKNYSFLLDIKLILLTIKSVFNRNSAQGSIENEDYNKLLLDFKDIVVIRKDSNNKGDSNEE
jgi:exopolysaccharide biosynthesis polyprenyl glycosylphosphotransferase